jgi:citrate synthase
MSKVLEDIVASVLRIDRMDVTDALAFSAIPEWDSLAHVNLMLALEAAYDVAIDEEQMVQLLDVATIRAFVNNDHHRLEDRV